MGDGRAPGFGPGRPGKPRHWEVIFLEGNTTGTYARQLDYFKIELGVLMPGNRVEYVKNLSNPRPERYSGAADAENRYYLPWQKGGLREADLELLTKAGVDPEGRPILKFIPPELESHLLQLERERAGKYADKVRATYFAIRGQGGGYEFFVRTKPTSIRPKRVAARGFGRRWARNRGMSQAELGSADRGGPQLAKHRPVSDDVEIDITDDRLRVSPVDLLHHLFDDVGAAQSSHPPGTVRKSMNRPP